MRVGQAQRTKRLLELGTAALVRADERSAPARSMPRLRPHWCEPEAKPTDGFKAFPSDTGNGAVEKFLCHAVLLMVTGNESSRGGNGAFET